MLYAFSVVARNVCVIFVYSLTCHILKCEIRIHVCFTFFRKENKENKFTLFWGFLGELYFFFIRFLYSLNYDMCHHFCIAFRLKCFFCVVNEESNSLFILIIPKNKSQVKRKCFVYLRIGKLKDLKSLKMFCLK